MPEDTFSPSLLTPSHTIEFFPADKLLYDKFPQPSRLIISVLFLYIFSLMIFRYTSLGIRLKATGINTFATNRFNFSSEKYIVFSFLIAGAIAGIAGFSQSSGAYHKLVPSVSGGFGFLSILIVLISVISVMKEIDVE